MDSILSIYLDILYVAASSGLEVLWCVILLFPGISPCEEQNITC